MTRVAARFAGYQPSRHCAEAAHAVAAWLTGQSSYRHSQLAPEQLALLDRLEGVGFTPVRAGFPYNRAALAVPYRREPIVQSSIRNVAQFLAARRSRQFQAELVTHLTPLVERASARLLLICGSCGLEFLAAALPRLPVPAGLEILAVALGPVGRVPAPHPRLRLYAVRGGGDLISRLCCGLATDLPVSGGHLDYADNPVVRDAVLRLATDFLR
jgi:hypothetical protein